MNARRLGNAPPIAGNAPPYRQKRTQSVARDGQHRPNRHGGEAPQARPTGLGGIAATRSLTPANHFYCEIAITLILSSFATSNGVNLRQPYW